MNNDDEREAMEEENGVAAAAAVAQKGSRLRWEKQRRVWRRIWRLRPQPRPGSMEEGCRGCSSRRGCQRHPQRTAGERGARCGEGPRGGGERGARGGGACSRGRGCGRGR